MGLRGKVLVAQGGGPTVVINQSLAGVVLESRKSPLVTRVYGAIKGVEGILNEDFLDLTQETSHNLEQVALTPASALLSTRDKPDSRYCQEMFQVMRAHDIRYFFYIGGNDSADTVRIINENANQSNYDLRAIHIPKTIDNDVVLNDHTPGYGSAARFVASAFSGANLDNISLPGVYIIVVMGRNAGFLTAASCFAQKFQDDGPHLIYLPEKTFSVDKFLLDVKTVYDRYGRCLVAVSEGIQDADNDLIVPKLVDKICCDAHGNLELTSNNSVLGDYLATLVKKNLQVKRVRSDTLGYFQRSFNGCISDVDRDEAREAGEKAAQFALYQELDGSVIIERTGYYSVEYRLKPLELVAGKTRVMPPEFINAAGNHITDAFKFYARPLLGSGFPTAHRLQAPPVPKILRRDPGAETF